jgi:hypothetical protein
MNITRLKQIIKEEIDKEIKGKYKSADVGKSRYLPVRKSDTYKYVYLVKSPKTHKEVWKASLSRGYNPTQGTGWIAYFDNEKDAALAVDKKLLAAGKQPVNVLKKK